MVRVSVTELPAASLAVTVMILWLPQWRGRLEIVQSEVPEAVPLLPWLLVQVTLVTPTSSEAVPLRVIVSSLVKQVVPKVGDVIAIVWSIVSSGGPEAVGVALARAVSE